MNVPGQDSTGSLCKRLVAKPNSVVQPGANGLHEGGWAPGKKGGAGDGSAISVRTEGALPPARAGPAAALSAAAAAEAWDAVNSRDQLLSRKGLTSSALVASRSPPRGPGTPSAAGGGPVVGGLFASRPPGAPALLRFDSAAENGGGSGGSGPGGAGLAGAGASNGSSGQLARGASDPQSELGRGGPSGDLSQPSEAGDTPHSLMATATSQGSLSRIDAMRFWMVRGLLLCSLFEWFAGLW